MEKIVYIFAASSARDSEFDYLLAADSSVPASQISRIRILNNTSVANIAAQILRTLGSGNSIKKLNVLSHGNAGHVMIGETMTYENISGMAPLHGMFSAINQGVLFHGCRIASAVLDRNPRQIHVLDRDSCALLDSMDPAAMHDEMAGSWDDRPYVETPVGTRGSIGYNFLRRAAVTMGVDVTASVDRQVTSLTGRGRSRVDQSGFEGTYVTVHPNDSPTDIMRGTSWRSVHREYCTF
jgi:hypothetical protein